MTYEAATCEAATCEAATCEAATYRSPIRAWPSASYSSPLHYSRKHAPNADNRNVKPVTRLPEFEDIRIAADCPNDIITIAASNDSNSGDPRFLYANEVCAYLFGYGVTDIVGSSIAKFDGPNTDRRTLSTQLPTQQLLFRQNASSHAC